MHFSRLPQHVWQTVSVARIDCLLNYWHPILFRTQCFFRQVECNFWSKYTIFHDARLIENTLGKALKTAKVIKDSINWCRVCRESIKIYSDVWCKWWVIFLIVGSLNRSVHFFRTIIDWFGVQHIGQFTACHWIHIVRWRRQTILINTWIRWRLLRIRLCQHKHNTNTNHNEIIHFISDFSSNAHNCDELVPSLFLIRARAKLMGGQRELINELISQRYLYGACGTVHRFSHLDQVKNIIRFWSQKPSVQFAKVH